MKINKFGCIYEDSDGALVFERFNLSCDFEKHSHEEHKALLVKAVIERLQEELQTINNRL